MKQQPSPNKLKVTLPLILVALFLAACGQEEDTPPASTPTPASTGPVVVQTGTGSITANGVLRPAQQVQLSFGVGGSVDSVMVEVGEHVEAGQPLAVLDSADLARAVAQAQLELDSAQARLAQVEADSTPAPERILAATTAISSAQAALTQAHIQASQRENQDTIDRAALRQAERTLADAQNEYQKVLDNPATRDWAPSSPAARALEEAQDYYEVVLAQANLHAADRGYAAAIASAEAQLAQAQLALYEAQHPVAAEALTLAQMDVERARLALDAAQVDLARSTLAAPFDGLVATVPVNVGEWTSPGTVAVELLDMSRWFVETRNVGELQIARVRVGQQVLVRVNAFQGETLNGTVATVSPVAVVQQGDTTYTLTIELEPTDLNLQPGMTARVEILTAE